MGKDYYAVLGIPKTANEDQIKKAYRKLALKWHPDRCKENKEEAQKKFQEIGEAFETLSDPEKKKIYDQVGEVPNGFESGGFPGGGMPGGMPGGVHFSFGGPGGGGHHRAAEDIFRQFFGTSNPFDINDDDGPSFGGMGGGIPFMMGGMPGGMGGMPGGMGRSSSSSTAPTKKAEAITYPLNVSLEDLYTGSTKKMKITSKRLVPGSNTTRNVASEKVISIKAGWKDGTKITYENEGDEMPGVKPADIIFVVKAKPHDRFERHGDDLQYTARLTLQEAICGTIVSVQTLDGRYLTRQIDHVTPTAIKIIPGEGMPNSKTEVKGDLKIKFEIEFPHLNAQDRRSIGDILTKYGRK